MRFLLPIIWSLTCLPSVFAALPSNAGRAITFFRDKDSSFPSGQASRSTLMDRIVQTDVKVQYLCKWDNREFTMQAAQLLTELSVSQYVDSKAGIRLLSLPRSASSAIANYSSGRKFEVITVENPWLRVRDTQSKKEGWVLSSQVKSRIDDLGYFRNLIRTPLRTEGTHSSAILSQIPQGERVKPLSIENGFIKFHYKNFVGYSDITHFVSRADFASFAFHKDKKWLPVRHRIGAQIQTLQNKTFELTSIQGYVTNPKKGIVIYPDHSYGPPLQAHVEIIKPRAFIWAQSRLSGHGLIWWKKEDIQLLDDVKTAQTLTTDQLMKRNIYEFALEGKDSLRGLVSSDGIYRTEDGLTWTKIDLFEEEKQPITIHPNGNWFVGSFRSKDNGRTFEPFIRWDRIAHAIESTLNTNPRYLRLNKIESLPNSRVAISVDTGNRKEVKLQSLIGDFQWSVVLK